MSSKKNLTRTRSKTGLLRSWDGAEQKRFKAFYLKTMQDTHLAQFSGALDAECANALSEKFDRNYTGGDIRHYRQEIGEVRKKKTVETDLSQKSQCPSGATGCSSDNQTEGRLANLEKGFERLSDILKQVSDVLKTE